MGHVIRSVKSLNGNPLSYFLCYKMFSLIGSNDMQDIIAMNKVFCKATKGRVVLKMQVGGGKSLLRNFVYSCGINTAASMMK